MKNNSITPEVHNKNCAIFDASLKIHSDNLKKVEANLRETMDIHHDALPGLAPDEIRFHPDYITAKGKVDSVFNAMRSYNSTVPAKVMREAAKIRGAEKMNKK